MKIWTLPLLLILTACPKPPGNAWFCDPEGYYVYRCIITSSVFPNQPVYHVGDTVTLSFYWPSLFHDSLSGASVSFNDQVLADPYAAIYYLEDDSLHPANGVDTTFDLIPVIGSAPESYFGGYPEYYLDFDTVDSGMVLEYKLVFHLPGRFLHHITMLSSGEAFAVELGNCPQETVQFCFYWSGADYYSSVFPYPHPYGLQPLIYTSYSYFRENGGFVFNVQP